MASNTHSTGPHLYSEEWWHATLSNIRDAVIVTDAAGNVAFMNPVAELLTGWTNNEAGDKALKEIFPIINENSRECVEDEFPIILSRLKEGKRIEQHETQRRRKDGSLVNVSLSPFHPSRTARKDYRRVDNCTGYQREPRQIETEPRISGGNHRVIRRRHCRQDAPVSSPAGIRRPSGYSDIPQKKRSGSRSTSSFLQSGTARRVKFWPVCGDGNESNTTKRYGNRKERYADRRIAYSFPDSGQARKCHRRFENRPGYHGRGRTPRPQLREGHETLVDSQPRRPDAVLRNSDLEKIVQVLTDEATTITRAAFGSFFYNVVDAHGASYMLYTLSGVPREHFANFPMPRATDLFGPTFRGEGVSPNR